MRSRFFIGVLIPFAVMVLIFTGCGKKEGAVGKTDLLKFVPSNAIMVLNFNVSAFTQLEAFDKLVEEKEVKEAKEGKKLFENYKDFVAKTGINPKTDIHAVTMAVFGKFSQKAEDAVAVVNLKYDKDKLLAVMKEKGIKYTEESYKSTLLYKVEETDTADVAFCFVSDALMAFGKTNRVKQVADLAANEGDNFYKNTTLSAYVKKVKTDAILSFIMAIPEEVRNQPAQGVPIQVDYSKAETVYGFGNYKNDVYSLEIVVVSANEDGNKQTVNSLNQMKGMGAMAGPEIAELLNNLKIQASADDIKFSLSLSGALLNKLMDKAKGKAAGQ